MNGGYPLPPAQLRGTGVTSQRARDHLALALQEATPESFTRAARLRRKLTDIAC